MKSICTVIIFSIFAGTALAQSEQDELVERHWSNGQRYLRQTMRRGYVHGLRTTWYEEGKMSTRLNYDMGTAHGVWDRWYRNGVRSNTVRLAKGRKIGNEEHW